MTTIAYLADARCSKYGAAGITELTKDLNQVIAQSPTVSVDAIIFNGDMDRIAQTLQAINASTVKNIPYYFVNGNHEAENSADIAAIRTAYPNTHLNFGIDIGEIHVCITNQYWDGANNDAYFKYASDDGGYIHPNLSSWISSNLTASTKKWKIVCGHEPLYPYKNHVGDSLDRDTANRDAFQALMVAKGVVAYGCGHTHYGAISKHDSISHFDAGNCGGQAGGSGQDDFASIMYIHTSGSDLVLTWKHEAPTWSTPSTTTYNIVGSNPPVSEIPVCGFKITQGV